MAARVIADVVVDVGKALAQTGTWIATRLAQVWAEWILPALRAVVRAFEAVREFFLDVFGPLLKWLEEFWLIILELYDKYVKPILTILDIVHRVTRVLGALGIEWAKDLDRWLTRIRQEINERVLAVVGKVNEIISWLNLLLDPRGLIRGEVFLTTIDTWVGGVWALLVNRGITGPQESLTKLLFQRHPMKDPKTALGEFLNDTTRRGPAVQLGLARFEQLSNELNR